MRTVRKFFTGLFNINKGIKTLRDKYIPSKKEVPKTKKEKKTDKNEPKKKGLARRLYDIKSSKRYASIKGCCGLQKNGYLR